MNKEEILLSKKENSRALYDCPPKLEEIIKVYNYAPATAGFRPAEDLDKEAREIAKYADFFEGQYSPEPENKKHYQSVLHQLLVRECQKYPEVLNIIEQHLIFGFYRQSSINTYYVYLCFRKYLDEIMEMTYYYHQTGRPGSVSVNSEQTTVFSISNDGKYKAKHSSTVAVLLDDALTDAMASRLRRCEVCLSIFWAKRKNSETCSTRCFNTLKQRKARKRKKGLEK